MARRQSAAASARALICATRSVTRLPVRRSRATQRSAAPHGRMLSSRLPPADNGASALPRPSVTISRSDPTHIKLLKTKSSSGSYWFLPPLTPHLRNTLLWLLFAASFVPLLALGRSPRHALEFATGYIVEYSLSVDNLFVFLLIFRYFKVPTDAQQTVLRYGILGAMLLRGIMILAGKALIDRFEWLAILFAALLIYSAGKLLFEDDDDSDLENNRVIALSRNLFPVADYYTGDKFFIHDGTRFVATPLMVVLIAIELSDVIFALDSVPAVLGISTDTLVIYTSNILAIMGLRSLFFVLSNTIASLRFLKQSLAIVLAFIGIKMIAACFGHELGIAWSLSVVTFTLALGIVLSLLFPDQPDPALSPSNSV